MIQKHAIPILEFDDNPQSVLMPTHEGLDLKLPKKCIYAFLEEEIDRYAQEAGADCVGEFVSATKAYPVYVINYKGETICLTQAPVVLPSCPVYGLVDWLWCGANHFHWNLWRPSRYRGKCLSRPCSRSAR